MKIKNLSIEYLLLDKNMEIKKLDISGFKGIPKLLLYPKKFNVLVGKNNTGKTSILEAIYLAFNPSATANMSIREILLQNYDKLSKLINIEYNEAVIKIKLSNKVKLVHIKRIGVEEATQEFTKQFLEGLKFYLSIYSFDRPSLSKSLFKKRLNDTKVWTEVERIINEILDNKNLIQEIIDTSIKIEVDKKPLYIFKTIPRKLATSPILIDYLRRNFPEGLILHIIPPMVLKSNSYVLKELSKKKDRAVTFIKNLQEIPQEVSKSKIHEIDNYLKRKKIIENMVRFDFDNILFDKNGKEYEIPFSNMGDGFKCLIGLIAQISKNTKIVLVEEPENHMHPAYIKEVLRTLISFSKTYGTQFFITTHSIDFLEVLTLDRLEPKYQKFLDKELRITRLDEFKGNIITQNFTRKRAKEELKDIQLDLRGDA